MRHRVLLFLLTLVFTGTTAAQTRLVERVTRSGDEIVIPYEKHVLPNGLTLVIHEDHSDPIVHVDVTYHVGSAREEAGKSGFAHFFEHMMFQGSENVADEEHFSIVSEAGGTLNGSTNRDRTNYFETLPSNQLETALWLEADRMGFFLDAVTPEKFEIQRATVKNERGERYDNAPYGLFLEKLAEALYPAGHSYSWLTIGTLEDLDRADLADLKRFFLRWYGPNNATLTVGGDVNPAEVVALTEKYFGVIPSGPAVENAKPQPVTLPEDRYTSYVDQNIRFPALIVTFPGVPHYHPDEAPLDYLANILGGGKSSLLYRRFVETRKALQANASHPTSELGGEFSMFVIPYPGTSLSAFEAELRQALLEFEQEGVSPADVAKYRAQREAEIINGLASVSGKVSQLAYFETFLGNPDFVKQDLARYSNVTPEDVMRVYDQYVKSKNSVVVSIVPAGMEDMAARPDNFVPRKPAPAPPSADMAGLTYTRPSGDTFERSRRPGAGQSKLVPVPDLWQEAFANGLKVVGTRSDELPTVLLQLTLAGGQKLDANHRSKAGLAQLTGDLLDESTQGRSAAELSDALERLGSTLSVSVSGNSTTLTVQTLEKNLDASLAIIKEVLLQPGFKQEDFDRIKQQQMEVIEQEQKDPESVADLVFSSLAFGRNSIRAIPVLGQKETVAAITLEDVNAFYRSYYSPSVSRLVVVGSVSQDELLPRLGFLRDWERKEVQVPKLPPAPAIQSTRIYLIDKEDAPQSQIRVGYVTGTPYDATGEFFKTTLMNHPLGGSFNSRINLNLREKRGFTYGAWAGFYSDEETSTFESGAGVRANVTDSSVAEVMKEIKEYGSGGITEEELAFMRNAVGQRDALKYETPGQKAAFLDRILKYGLDPDHVAEQKRVIDTISADELNTLARKYLPAGRMNIVVVGDKKTIKPGLERLGYEVVEIGADGATF